MKKVDAKSPLLTEVHARWRCLFSGLLRGSDLPPGQQLRTEGLMEAVLLTRELTVEGLLGQMAQVYREINGHSMEERFGAGWRQFYPFPQIPAEVRRAPVYPSTTD